MGAKFEDIAASLTARRGNHPVLWLVVGACSAFAAISSVVDGQTLFSMPRLWRALHGMPMGRFEEVSFASEPFAFVLIVLAFALCGAFSIAVGVTSLRFRARMKGQPHRFADIVDR